MKYEADHQGNVVRVWDDDGRLIYATRANWGLEADRRNSHIPHKFGTYYRTGTGERSGLWREFVRAIRDVRPRYAVVENSGDLTVRGLDAVLGDLHELGFDAEWSVVSACSMGAPHRRRRLFVVAYRSRRDESGEVPHNPLSDRGHPDWRRQPRGGCSHEGRQQRWLPEPDVGRVAHGVPARVVGPRLAALGNAVVPQVAEYVGRRVMEHAA